MKHQEYLDKRNALIGEADALLVDHKIDECKAKQAEVETLDAAQDVENKEIANLTALKGSAKLTNLETKSINVQGGVLVGTMAEVKPVNETEQYLNAWGKTMMGKKLDTREQEVFAKINAEFNNAYTHDAGNTAVLIPETVAAGIWSRAAEMYPLYGDARKYAVPGILSIKKHTAIAAGDAAWYAEATAVTDEQNTFGEMVLDGCELAKSVTVSWKLKAMAMAEFIPYIVNELGERCGAALGKAAAAGAGGSATPPEPEGVETALLAEASTPQVVTYDPDHATVPVPLTYGLITEAIGKIFSSYLPGCAIYAKNSTIWSQIANLLDGFDRPLFVPDVSTGGVGRILGMPVKPDEGITGMNILIGNASKGLVFNVNAPMSIVTEDHAKTRTTDYVAYGIIDGGVMDTRAFALIQEVI